MASIAGLPLRYLIGLANDNGEKNALTEPGYDTSGLPSLGVGVGYVNRRQEEKGRKPGIDYIDPPDDIEQEYGEPAPVFGTEYFWANIDTQTKRLRSLGFEYVEIDNIDVDSVEQTLQLFDHVASLGLAIFVKNPSNARLLAHPFAVAVIQEHDSGMTAAKLDKLRQDAHKPTLPIRVVTYDDQRPWAQTVATAAAAMVDFGVTYSAKGEYESVEHLLRPIMPATSAAPWVDVLEADIGRYHDGPDVPMLAVRTARRFPDDKAMASYVTMAGQDTAWCGIYCGEVLSRYGIKPPLKDTGVGGWMYVDAWLALEGGTRIQNGQQKPGDLALWLKSDLHHISFYFAPNQYIGGNQSNSVTKAAFRTPDAFVRPPPAAHTEPVPESMPILMIQSTGDQVRILQTMLVAAGYSVGESGVDGDFGADTETAVKAYQTDHNLEVDGIVGPETWTSLYAEAPPIEPVPPGEYLLTPEDIAAITQLAASSAIAKYSWQDRGKAPLGYTKGLAVMYAQCALKLAANDSAVLAMTQPIGTNSKDALAWYNVSATGRDNVLRKLFVMLYGLGMRESSGNYTEGRDMSASNVTADTAEAGLFQQSWNSSNSSNEMKKLLPAYEANKQPCYSNIFKEGITPKTTQSYGTGPGRQYQDQAKACPAFAVEMCAVGLRVLYNHWGPIIRQEAEMRAEAETLLLNVDRYLADKEPIEPPEPEPEPIDDLIEAKHRAMTSIEAAVDALITDVIRITEKDATPQVTTTAVATSGGVGRLLPMLPPEVTTSLLRFAWPYISRLTADQIIEIKDKITSGEFGVDDLLALVTSGGVPGLTGDLIRALTEKVKR